MRIEPLSQWQIIGPDGPVGSPGTAYAVYQECTRLNDEANPDPAQIRQVFYRVERAAGNNSV